MKNVVRPETEMKESGASWMGKIPCEWSVSKLKWYLRRVDPRNPGDKQVLSLYREFGVIPKDSRDDNHNATSEDTSKYKYVRVGDFVVNKMKAWQGSVAVSEYDGIVSPAYYVYHFTDDSYHRRYFHYLLRSCYKEEFMRLSGGIRVGQWDLSSNDLDNVLVVIPKKEEQQVIADYLDKTCSKIDEIIAEAKVSIDEYKELKQSVIDKAVLHGLCNGMMKDSGNDLIGKIPLSWEMRKLKYVADFNPGITTAYDAQKEVGYVPMNCVKNGYMNPLSARLSDMSTGLTGFQDGDIVIAKVTPCFENGNIAVAENLEQGVAFGSSELFVIRTHSINRRFMLYYLQNSVFKNQCISTMTGTGGLKRVSGYFVNNAYITYPPENEQQVIVNYLDEAVKNMDFLIAEKESLINDLEAYKKSLIYEVVTGKRRVV